MSEKLEVWVKREGKVHYMDFVRGDTQTKLKVIGKVGAREREGTKIHFKPDHQIFTETRYDYATLASRLRELSFLNKGVTITLPVDFVTADRFPGSPADIVAVGRIEGR